MCFPEDDFILQPKTIEVYGSILTDQTGKGKEYRNTGHYTIRAEQMVNGVPLMGGIIGIIIGSIATTTVGKLAGLNATPTPMAVIVSFSVSVAIGLFFGYMPARRAASLNPIDALRSE